MRQRTGGRRVHHIAQIALFPPDQMRDMELPPRQIDRTIKDPLAGISVLCAVKLQGGEAC
jgi:hypothetical protein